MDKEKTEKDVKNETKKEEAVKENKKSVKKPAAKKAAKPAAKKAADKTKESAPKKKTVKKAAPEKSDKPVEGVVSKFKITIPGAEINGAIEDLAAKYARDIKLPGFRKGAVSPEIVKNRYKQGITDEALQKIVEQKIFEKIQKDDLKIATQPVIENMDYEDGKDLNADVTVELYPEVKIPELEGFVVEINKKDIESEKFDEEKQIKAILEANKRQNRVTDRPAKDEDVVMIKYQTKVDKRMTPKAELRFEVKKDGEALIKDLYKEIVGKKSGDKFEIKRKYAKDYSKKRWAGREVEHFITVDQISEMQIPELNEEFMKTMGITDEKIFRTQLKEEYEKYQEHQKSEKVSSMIMQKIVEGVDVALSDNLILSESARMNPQFAQIINQADDEKKKELMEIIRPNSEQSIKMMLVMETLLKDFKVEISNDDMEAEFKKISETNNYPVAQVRKFYMNPQEKAKLKESLQSKKLIELIKEKVTVKEV